MWQKRWKEGTLKIQSNTGRRRINIMWWVDAIKHNFTWIAIEEKCNKETTIQTFEKIRNFYDDYKKIVIILDNAKYQHCYKVVEFAELIWIELMFLPPYSPNLNLIERLWKFIKKTLYENRYYSTFEEFKLVTDNFLENFGNYSEEVWNLINWKFQIMKYA